MSRKGLSGRADALTDLLVRKWSREVVRCGHMNVAQWVPETKVRVTRIDSIDYTRKQMNDELQATSKKLEAEKSSGVRHDFKTRAAKREAELED